MNGAEDPVSGAIALLEEARGLGTLLKQGWHPKRTVILCFWDGEEEGLLGSTEWAEAHQDELRKYGAVYINSDGNGRGYLGVEGSHTLEKFINSVARDVEDRRRSLPFGSACSFARFRHRARRRVIARICGSALGSGSDYTRSSTTSAWRRSTWALAAKTREASTTRSTTTSTGTRTSPTAISCTLAPSPRQPALPSCAWLRFRATPLRLRQLHRHHQALHRRSPEARQRQARPNHRTQQAH